MTLWQSSGDLEHLTGSFTIRGSYDGSVDIQEASVLEECMSGKGQCVSNPRHSSESVGSSSQMGVLPESLHHGPTLDWILAVSVSKALDEVVLDVIDCQLKWLTRLGRLNKSTLNHQGSSSIGLSSKSIALYFALSNHLQALEAAAVVQLDEGELLLVHSSLLGPTSNSNGLADEFLVTLPQSGYADTLTVGHRCYGLLRNKVVSIHHFSNGLWAG